MAIVSEYVRGLGLIPLVIQPLTPKLFFKQKIPDGTYDVDTMGKAYLVTVAEQKGPALVIMHYQSRTPDIFLPLSCITKIEHLSEFEGSFEPSPDSKKATALCLRLSGDEAGLMCMTPISGISIALLWSPDPNVGVTLEGYIDASRNSNR